MRLTEKEIQEELGVLATFKHYFNTPDGEIVLEHLKKICSFFSSTCSASDVTDLSKFREGRRTVILDILAIKGMDLEAHRKQLMERQAKAEEDDDIWYHGV